MKYLPLLLLFAIAACTPADDTPTTTPSTMSSSSQPDSLLRHAVLFSLDKDSDPDGVKGVEEAFAALPGKIPQIYGYEWGTNNSPEGLEKGFTHLFFVTFKSEADRDAYLIHPDHLAFVEFSKPQIKDVLVLDYWAK